MASNPRRRSSSRYDDRMRLETFNLEQQYKERDEEIQKKKQDHMERLEERIRSTQHLASLPRGKSSPTFSSVAAKAAADSAAAVNSSATPRASSSLTARLTGATTPTNTPRMPTSARSSDTPRSNEATPRASSTSSASSSSSATLSSPTRSTPPRSSITSTSSRSPSSSITSTSSYSSVVTGGTHSSKTTSSTTTTTSTYRARSPSYSPTSSRYSSRTSASSSTYTSSTPIYKEVPVVRKPSRAAQEINNRPSPALQSPRGAPSPKGASPKASPRKTPSSSPKVSPRADQSLYSIRSFCDIPEVQTPSNPSSPRPTSPTKRQRRNSTRGRNSPRRNSNAAPPVVGTVEQPHQQFLCGLHIRSNKVEMKGSLMAHAAEDQVFIWDLAAEQCVTVFSSHTATVSSVSMFTWEASGVTLVTSSSSEETLVWDAATGAVVKALPGAHFSSVFYYANQSSDSSKYATSARRQAVGPPKLAIPKLHILVCHNSDIEIWDFEKVECVQTLRGHKAQVNAATLMHTSMETPRGTSVAVATAAKKALVLSASADGSMRVWDLATGNCEKTLWHCDPNAAAGVDAMSVSEAGRFAVSVSADERSLKVWDLQPPYDCVFSRKLTKGSSQLVSMFIEDTKLDAHMDASAISIMQNAREKSEIVRFTIDDNASVVLLDRNNITVGTASGEPFFCYKS